MHPPMHHTTFLFKLIVNTNKISNIRVSLLGSEVDKLSKILTKTSNIIEYIESDIQNI